MLSTRNDRLRFSGKVKNNNRIFTAKEPGNPAVSTTGIIEAIRSEPALYQHRRNHGRHERDVPEYDPAGDGSGDG